MVVVGSHAGGPGQPDEPAVQGSLYEWSIWQSLVPIRRIPAVHHSHLLDSDGTSIFFPIVNSECSSLEAFPFHGDTPQQRQACAKAWIDNVTGLSATIDGKTIANLAPLRTRSGDFSFTVPNNNILVGAGPAWGFSSADGYYVYLDPLSPGVHTIQITATLHDPFDPTHPIVGTINTTLFLTVGP
jgi:hypothetical protein